MAVTKNGLAPTKLKLAEPWGCSSGRHSANSNGWIRANSGLTWPLGLRHSYRRGSRVAPPAPRSADRPGYGRGPAAAGEPLRHGWGFCRSNCEYAWWQVKVETN